MDLKETMHLLKFRVTPKRFSVLEKQLETTEDLDKKMEILYPFKRQFGKRVYLKKKTIFLDSSGKKFSLNSKLGKILSKDLDGYNYEIQFNKSLERGVKLKLITKIDIYSIWIDNKIYYLYGDRYGERESNKEIVNDWEDVNLEMFGYKKYNFTLRSVPDFESFVEFYKEEPENFHIKFLEYLL